MRTPRVFIDLTLSPEGNKRTVSIDADRIDAVFDTPNLCAAVIANGHQYDVQHTRTEVLCLIRDAHRLADERERERGRPGTAEIKVTPVRGGVL